MQLQSNYFGAYHNLKLTRDDKGVLVAEFHSNGGPFIMSARLFGGSWARSWSQSPELGG